MQYRNREDLLSEELDGSVDLMQQQIRFAAIEGKKVGEGIGIALAEHRCRAGVSVNWDMHSLQLVEAPEIVEAASVVGVGVGHEDRVHPAHVISERLCAQLRRGIDEDGVPVVADKRRSAAAA